MSLIGRLFGTTAAVDNILDKEKGLLVKVGAWVNDLNHTESEQSAANQITREWGIRQLDALGPFKVVQRVIAFAVTAFWCMCGVSMLVAIWVNDVDIIANMSLFATSDFVVWPTLTIFSLYFSGGVVESYKRISPGG